MGYKDNFKPLGAITTVDESDNRYIARINEEFETDDGERIRLNVFLPHSGGPKFPVLMAATPYGKDVPYIDNEVYKKSAVDVPEVMKSKHLSWEAPAPSWWCPHGYAVVIMDHRGSGASSGASKIFSTQNWDDYAKAIEWAADQPWSTGKIGLTGVSYLGLNQWPTAARQPRGLACIVPWEGMSDYYRDAGRHGGIYHNGFNDTWYHRQVTRNVYGSRDRSNGCWGPTSPEGELSDSELNELHELYPKFLLENEWIDDEWYKDRIVGEDYSKIEVPLLSAGNWGGTGLHLRGNVLGYMRASSPHKFLRIHTGRHDLPYYLEPYITYLKSFYDCFLKGDDYDGWKTGKQAPVAFAVRRGTQSPGSIQGELEYKFREEKEWPLARTKYQQLYLTADKMLSKEKPPVQATLSYKAPSGECIQFITPVAEEEYEVTGHGHVRLAVSLTDHKGEIEPDIDVFVALRKINAQGNESSYSSSLGTPTPVVFGWLRASHRTIDPNPYPDRFNPPAPVLSHKKSDKKEVRNGEVYDLKIELWPTNVVVEKGERLVLEISPKDPAGDALFACYDPIDRDERKLGGTNNVHIGEGYESYVSLPIV
ncbi:Alpha/Beta hydrolase protein [Trichoderma austrokoningii]